MAIDMSQFYQVFFEEAAEHLASMEALLLAIDPAAPDEEDVNALFRAARHRSSRRCRCRCARS